MLILNMQWVAVICGVLGFGFFLAAFVPDKKDKRYKSGIKNNEPTSFSWRRNSFLGGLVLLIFCIAYFYNY
tara:strand:+ start:1138 stop:1350 length:213 start_codon:yes stop_codon:yes gene_type:complete